MTSRTIALGAALAAAVMLSTPSLAQERTLRILVGFPPGGTTDLLARLLAERLREPLGQNVIVENKPGAVAAIAATEVKNAPADGATLLMSVVGAMTVAPHARKSNTFDTLKDFAPVSLVTHAHLAIAVGPGSPAKDLKGFLDWAKGNPGKAFYATSGAGTLPHMLGLLLAKEAGVQLTHVPYKGTSAYINELVGGQVPAAFDAMGDLSEQHKAGRIRILASAGAARSKAMPEIPTIREQGYNIEGAAWFGLFAPAATPRATVERLSQAVARVLQNADIAARISSLNMEPVGSTPEEFQRVVRADWAKWGAVVRASGFTID
jgi:tripartite-type tricarboxylate transporter receptor subunit TctC